MREGREGVRRRKRKRRKKRIGKRKGKEKEREGGKKGDEDRRGEEKEKEKKKKGREEEQKKGGREKGKGRKRRRKKRKNEERGKGVEERGKRKERRGKGERGRFIGPPSPDYIPRPKEPQSPPPPDFVPEPVYPEFMPPKDEILPAEEKPIPAADSPTADSPGYIPKRLTRFCYIFLLLSSPLSHGHHTTSQIFSSSPLPMILSPLPVSTAYYRSEIPQPPLQYITSACVYLITTLLVLSSVGLSGWMMIRLRAEAAIYFPFYTISTTYTLPTQTSCTLSGHRLCIYSLLTIEQTDPRLHYHLGEGLGSLLVRSTRRVGEELVCCLLLRPASKRCGSGHTGRQEQLTKALKLVKRLQTQMAELQRQHGPVNSPAQPDALEEAGSSS
ncbi:hypothetical protein Tco_0632983 [Tanacetum coccineum]